MGIIASKIIGIAIIVGSLFVKVPLIQNCLRTKSTEGLSVASARLEILALTLFAVYNIKKGFPFTIYGDVIFGMSQSYIMLFLFWYYNKFSLYQVGFELTIYCALLLILSLVSPSILPMLTIIGLLCSWSSLIPQIVTNFANEATGNLSLATQGATTFGLGMRLITIIIEVDDFLSLAGSLLGLMLHSLLLVQLLYYNRVVPFPSTIESGMKVLGSAVTNVSIDDTLPETKIAIESLRDRLTNFYNTLPRAVPFLEDLDNREFKHEVDSSYKGLERKLKSFTAQLNLE